MKTIPGFPNYKIDEHGVVYGPQKGRLNFHYNEKGYQHAFLYNGKRRCLKVHRIVAELYVENPNNYTEVNHIDGNKKNNHYTNLEWCSRSENVRHAIKHGLIRNRKGELTETSKPVRHNHTGQIYNSMAEAARRTGLSYKQVYTNRKKIFSFI
jgi:hypothetical protein